MTSLNDHDKQLLETLLNQADAVAPAVEKTHHSEHEGDLGFPNAVHDDHDFRFLDQYINSDMGEAEAMQFEQPGAAAGYARPERTNPQQQTSQQTPTKALSPTTAGSSFADQGSSGYAGQPAGFSGVAAAVQSPLQVEQTSPAPYVGQGHSYQHLHSPPVQSQPQISIPGSEGFQGQPVGYQQQYPASQGTPAQTGQLKEAGTTSSGFSQTQAYPQHYSIDMSSNAQADISGHASSTYQTPSASYQTQPQQPCSDTQTQAQQLSQHDSGYPGTGSKEQVNLSTAVYHNQSTEYQTQQTFQSDFAVNNNAANSSLPPAEVTGFQQQKQPTTQQTVFHQSGQAAGNNASADQTYQASATDGAALNYAGDLSGYTQQTTVQQHQGITPGNTAVGCPDASQGNSAVPHQHTQFQQTTPSKAQGDQGASASYQTPSHVNQFQKQQSFSSPVASPSQPTQMMPSGSAGYPQPSGQPSYPPSGQVQVQGDHHGGANITGQVPGFSSGQVSTFPKELSFSSPAPSSGQNRIDMSVPTSPATNYQQQQQQQQPPPAYNVQNTYSPHVPSQPLGQDDQTGGNFPAQAASFPQTVSPLGDQSGGAANYQGTDVYLPKSAMQEDPAIAGSYQGKPSPYSRPTSAKVDTKAFGVSATPGLSLNEASDHNSIVEAAAFWQKFQSENQQNQAIGGSSTGVPYGQNAATQPPPQRDQPMETQQSPYLGVGGGGGSGSGTEGFANRPQPPAQQGILQEPALAGSTSVAGSVFSNQTLSFQGQSEGYLPATDVPSQSLPSSISGILPGPSQGQNISFQAGNKLDDAAYHIPSTGVFGSQTVFSSSQTTNTSFSSTNSTPSVMSNVQPVTSPMANIQYNQATETPSTFNQFQSGGVPAFGHNTGMPEHQQFQQAVQQTVVIQNSNSQALLTENRQTLLLAAGSQGSSAVLSKELFPTGPFQAASDTAQQQCLHNLSGQPASGVMPLSTMNQMQLAQATTLSVQLPSLPASAPIPNNISVGKSPASSLQDSNQTNTTLSLLSSVLQQIQAILPAAANLQQNPTNNAQPAAAQVQTVGRENSEAMAKLLQSQGSAQQVLQLLQQQAGLQKNLSPIAQQQSSGQEPSFAQQLQQQLPANFSVTPSAQHPNFLVQQGNNQPVVALVQPGTNQPVVALTQNQQAQQVQQQQQQQLNQPMGAHVPSSVVVTSLASTLEGLGATIGSDGQFALSPQAVKVVLDANSTPMTVSAIFNVPSSVIAQSSIAGTSLSADTTLAFSGAGQCVPVQSAPQSTPVPMGVPMDLQYINLPQLTSTSISSSSSSLTHAINTTPTTAPHIGSTFSTSTFVTPTCSFPQPLQVAGVGLGVGAPISINSCPDTSADPATHPNPSNPDPGGSGAQVLASGNGGVDKSPAVANIFYPVSTESCLEKALAAPLNAAPVGNFLNVTTGGCASMLLNAFSMVAADQNDGKRDSSGIKVNNLGSQGRTVDSAFTDYHTTNQVGGKVGASEMDVGEPIAAGSSRGVRPMDTDKPLENLTPRHSFRKTSMEEDAEQRGDAITNSMLRKILTMKDEDDNTPHSKAASPTPGNSPVQTPIDLVDGNTQATLIEKSEKLRLCSDAQHEDEVEPTFWTAVPSFANTNSPQEQEVIPSKVHRGVHDLDCSSKQVSMPSVEKLFDAGGAVSSSAFVFTKFGAEVPGIIAFGNSSSETVSTTVDGVRVSSMVTAVKQPEPMKLTSVPTASIRPNARKQKEPGLTFQFPSKVAECELRIIAQPEEQHRARYLTEGSRGAVKDRSQQGYPVIKLLGYNEPAILQVFIGCETGRVKPHGFYQACKVCGKNSTQCGEREIDGTSVIEIEISPINDMQVNMDCVGILKLRNADVEKRIGPTKAKAKKKNSTKARLVFRTTLRKPDGSHFTLQAASTPILCTQPIGQPEISRLSLSELCVNQTSDMFIIGKNFLKGTQIMFQELEGNEVDVKWQSEAEIEVEYFQQTHLICRIPDYPYKDLDRPVHCQIVAISGGKVSDPQDFVFKPAMVMIKEENAMEIEPSGAGKALPFGVSPVALHLNRLVERTQHTQHPASSSAMFQLPPGTVPSITNSSIQSMLGVGAHAPPGKMEVLPGAQPLSSILKPAALSLPGSGQMLTLGPGEGNSKGAVPVQFVLPPHAMGSLDSRKLGGQQPQFVLMPNSAVTATAAAGCSSSSTNINNISNISISNNTINNNKLQQSVFTLNSVPTNSNNNINNNLPVAVSSSVGVGPGGSLHGGPAGPISTAGPMIVILTGGAPNTALPTNSSAVVCSAVSAGDNVMAAQISAQQPVTSGQGPKP